jgi:hypothetical protein
MKTDHTRRELRAAVSITEQGFWERAHAEWMESASHWRQYAAEYHSGYGWWRNAMELAKHARQFCKSIP